MDSETTAPPKPALPPHEVARLARKYVWWSDPARVAEEMDFLLASVMDKGSWDDLGLLRTTVDPEILRGVLRAPPRGLFRPGSWILWHLWLGLPCRPLPKAHGFQ